MYSIDFPVFSVGFMYNNVRHICHGGQGGYYRLLALQPGEHLVALRGTIKVLIQSVSKQLFFFFFL